MDETVICKRDDLYSQVWAEPMQTVAQRYGVSGVALGKICRKLRVPVPGRGFWARRAAGYNVVPPKLPPLQRGQPSQHVIQRRVALGSAMADEVRDQSAAEAQRIDVPATLESPHQLVRRSESLVRRAARPRSKTEVGKHHCLDIRVGEQAVDRAIRIADALIKALEARGFPVEITAPEMTKPRNSWERPSLIRSKTRVLISGEPVEFSIEEAHDTVAVDLTKDPHYGTLRFKFRPAREQRFNGKLIFRIGSASAGRGVQHNWADGKVQRVENQLNSIVRGLVVAANAQQSRRLERERMNQEHEESQRRVEEHRVRQEREARRVVALGKRLALWQEARAIEELVSAIEAAGKERPNDASDPRLSRWIAWARRRARHLSASAIRRP